MRALLPLIILAACGPKAATPSTGPAGDEIANDVPSGRETTPCPDAARLGEIARDMFEWQGGTPTMTCVPIYAGEPLWLINGYVDIETPDFVGVSEGSAIVTTAGEQWWLGEYGEMPWGTFEAMTGEGWRPVDLDGDGNDELLYFGGYSKHGDSETHVTPYLVGDHMVFTGTQLQVSYDNAAAVENEADIEGCAGTVEVIDGPDGTKRVAITRTPIGRGVCEPPGRRVYALSGTDLKEVE